MKKRLVTLALTLALVLPGCQTKESEFHRQLRETFQEYKERLDEIHEKEKTTVRPERYKTFPKYDEEIPERETTYFKN
jgi:hypothetical protein